MNVSTVIALFQDNIYSLDFTPDSESRIILFGDRVSLMPILTFKAFISVDSMAKQFSSITGGVLLKAIPNQQDLFIGCEKDLGKSDPDSKRDHLFSCLDIKPFKCADCQTRLNSPRSYQFHVRTCGLRQWASNREKGRIEQLPDDPNRNQVYAHMFQGFIRNDVLASEFSETPEVIRVSTADMIPHLSVQAKFQFDADEVCRVLKIAEETFSTDPFKTAKFYFNEAYLRSPQFFWPAPPVVYLLVKRGIIGYNEPVLDRFLLLRVLQLESLTKFVYFRNRNKQRELECATCKKKFPKQSNLISHLFQDEGLHLGACLKCKRTFTDIREYFVDQVVCYSGSTKLEKNNLDLCALLTHEFTVLKASGQLPKQLFDEAWEDPEKLKDLESDSSDKVNPEDRQDDKEPVTSDEEFGSSILGKLQTFMKGEKQAKPTPKSTPKQTPKSRPMRDPSSPCFPSKRQRLSSNVAPLFSQTSRISSQVPFLENQFQSTGQRSNRVTSSVAGGEDRPISIQSQVRSSSSSDIELELPTNLEKQEIPEIRLSDFLVRAEDDLIRDDPIPLLIQNHTKAKPKRSRAQKIQKIIPSEPLVPTGKKIREQRSSSVVWNPRGGSCSVLNSIAPMGYSACEQTTKRHNENGKRLSSSLESSARSSFRLDPFEEERPQLEPDSEEESVNLTRKEANQNSLEREPALMGQAGNPSPGSQQLQERYESPSPLHHGPGTQASSMIGASGFRAADPPSLNEERKSSSHSRMMKESPPSFPALPKESHLQEQANHVKNEKAIGEEVSRLTRPGPRATAPQLEFSEVDCPPRYSVPLPPVHYAPQIDRLSSFKDIIEPKPDQQAFQLQPSSSPRDSYRCSSAARQTIDPNVIDIVSQIRVKLQKPEPKLRLPKWLKIKDSESLNGQTPFVALLSEFDQYNFS